MTVELSQVLTAFFVDEKDGCVVGRYSVHHAVGDIKFVRHYILKTIRTQSEHSMPSAIEDHANENESQ